MATTPGRPRPSAIPAPGRVSSIPAPSRPRSSSSVRAHHDDSTTEMTLAFADAIRANDPTNHRLTTAVSSSSLSPKSAAVNQSGRRSVAGRPSSVASSTSALSTSTRPGARTPHSTRPSSRSQSRQSDFGVPPTKPRSFDVGDNVRIESLGFEGVLRYVGEIDGKPGQWAGVQLSGGFAGKGKNDGSVAGVHYFTCPPNCGVFVALSKLSAPTVGASSTNRPPSAASHRSTSMPTSGRITPSYSTSSYSAYSSRAPSASYSNGRITPAAGRATPSATPRVPSVNRTPSNKTVARPVPAASKTPVALTEKITAGSRASKYMSMTAKDLSSRDSPTKAFAPRSPTSPKNGTITRQVASPTRAPGSPFTTPRVLTSSKLGSIGSGKEIVFGKGRPSGTTPRAKLPSGVSMPPPASPFAKGRALQDEDTTGDEDAGPIFTGKLTFSRPGSSASLESEESSLVSQLKSRLDALEYENERLRTLAAIPPPEPVAVEGDNAELEQLKVTHQETLAQVIQLQQELADAKELALKQEGQLGSLKEDLEKAGKDLEAQKLTDEELLAGVKTELEAALKDMQELKQLCEEKDGQLAEFDNELVAKEGEIGSLRSKLESTTSELEEERKELNLQIDELRIAGQETIALYEERLSDIEAQRYDLECRFNSLLEKASQVDAPVAAKTETNLSATEIDNETLREQVTHLQRKISMMEEIIEDSRANAEKLEDNVREKVKRLKEKEDAMKKELEVGRKEVERMARAEEAARHRVEEVEEALRESTIALESARAETEVLRNELTDLDNLVEGSGDSDISTRVVEYTRRIASEREQNEKEIAQLRQLLAEKETSGSGGESTQALQNELSRLKALNDDLDEELAKVRAELEDREKDLRDLKKKLRDVPVVNGTLDTSKGLSPSPSKDGVKEELAGMKHIVQELQKENSSAQQKIKLLESENQLLKSEAESLRQEVAILESNLDNSLAKEDGHSVESDMSDDVVSLQRRLRDQGQELEQLRKKLSELEMKHARTVHDLNKEISEMEALVESKIYREDELEQEIERLKDKVSRYKKSSKESSEKETFRLSTASISSGASEGGLVCEICERPGHDIFNCDLLKDDVRQPAPASTPTPTEPYCADCESFGHLPADCPHSQDVF